MFRTAMALAMLVAQPVGAAEKVELTTWEVPWPDTRPRDPDVAPDGSVWFVGQAGNYLARLDPRRGTFERVPLPQGTKPHNLIVDRTGAIWYAGNGAAHIGRYDPKTRAMQTHAMPDATAKDPHTLAFDGKGRIWFTAQRSNFIGRLTMRDGSVELLKVPTPDALPYGIVADPDGNAWAVLFGAPKLVAVDADGPAIREIALPRPETRARRLARTRDGRIWYADFLGGRLGAYNPKTNAFAEWPMPSGKPGAYAMTVDDRDRLWIVESGVQPNLLVAFDPAVERFTQVMPVASVTVRHMVFHPPTRSLWFGTDNNRIMRATLVE